MTQLTEKRIRQRSNRIATHCPQTAALQEELADRLLSRLDFMKITPKRILDCGARSGYTTDKLKQRYPKADIIALDFSEKLLQQSSHPFTVCSHYDQLPFPSQHFDLVFSHFAIPWVNDLPQMLRECYRVLHPESLLLFTTTGPDTLLELRASLQQLQMTPRLHDFIDMHDIGDFLLQTGFEDPVMDRENVELHYDHVNTLMNDLKHIGATNARFDAPRGLQGREEWNTLLNHYQQQWQLKNNDVSATIELIYGHAWVGERISASINAEGEAVIPISAIRSEK